MNISRPLLQHNPFPDISASINYPSISFNLYNKNFIPLLAHRLSIASNIVLLRNKLSKDPFLRSDSPFSE
jgi:hypothetical protein